MEAGLPLRNAQRITPVARPAAANMARISPPAHPYAPRRARQRSRNMPAGVAGGRARFDVEALLQQAPAT